MRLKLIEDFWKYIDHAEFKGLTNVMAPNAKVFLANTKEAFNSSDEYIQFNIEYPGRWHAEIENLLVSNEETVSIVKISGEDATLYVTSVFKFDNDLISEITEYWGENSNPPEWRKDKHLTDNTPLKFMGIDIGGTMIKFGLFENNILSKKIELNTTNDIIKVLKDGISKLASFNELASIGIAIPAPIKGNYMFSAPNLPWSNMDILSHLKEELNFDNIKVINDANAAALGEYNYGDKHDSVVLVTLGTGVGGGIVIDGNVIEGHLGLGGEIGHIPLDNRFNFQCGCGATGCAETVTSATGLKNIYKSISGKDLGTVEIFKQAKAGEETASEVVNIYVSYLSKLCHTITVTSNPEVIIFGGGVSKAGDYLLNKIKDSFYSRNSFDAFKSVEIKIASLGNDSGMYGAYYLAKKAS